MKYQQQLQATTLYQNRDSLEFNGTDDFMAVFSGFGADTFPIRRSNKVSISMWVKYTGVASPTAIQVLASRWFPTPTFAINEGGWRIYLQTESASGNPEVTRGMWVHLSTNIFQGVWIYSKASFPLNTWVHVCVTWDGNTTPGVGGLKLYWDAVEHPSINNNYKQPRFIKTGTV